MRKNKRRNTLTTRKRIGKGKNVRKEEQRNVSTFWCEYESQDSIEGAPVILT